MGRFSDAYWIAANDPLWPLIALLWGMVALALLALLVTGAFSGSSGFFTPPWLRDV